MVLSFESNLAFESQHLLKAFERNNVKKWIALSEGAGGTLGWLTTNERKEVCCGCFAFSTQPSHTILPRRLCVCKSEMRSPLAPSH